MFSCTTASSMPSLTLHMHLQPTWLVLVSCRSQSSSCMYLCVADKAFESSTTISTLALHAYLSRHSLLPSILLYESSGVPSSGVGAFGMIRKPESYHIVSRYQVATPSRTITARATGLLHTCSFTPSCA